MSESEIVKKPNKNTLRNKEKRERKEARSWRGSATAASTGLSGRQRIKARKQVRRDAKALAEGNLATGVPSTRDTKINRQRLRFLKGETK